MKYFTLCDSFALNDLLQSFFCDASNCVKHVCLLIAVVNSPCSRTCWWSYGHSFGNAPGSSGQEPPSPSAPRASLCRLLHRSTSTVIDTNTHKNTLTVKSCCQPKESSDKLHGQMCFNWIVGFK